MIKEALQLIQETAVQATECRGVFTSPDGRQVSQQTPVQGLPQAVHHLFRYVGEQAFRFNFRDLSDQGRFCQLMLQVVGKRITYRELCAIDDAGFMGIR